MKGLGLLLVLFLPTTAFALSAQDKADIADKLTKAYAYSGRVQRATTKTLSIGYEPIC
jgi:hypothetical protein